jgi:hypothetical protein
LFIDVLDEELLQLASALLSAKVFDMQCREFLA